MYLCGGGLGGLTTVQRYVFSVYAVSFCTIFYILFAFSVYVFTDFY